MTEHQNFSLTFNAPCSPMEAYLAITNVRGWWSEDISGSTDRLGTFEYRYGDLHRCRIEVTELVPARRVAWHVVENYFSFTKDKSEWTGTDMVFEIAEAESGSAVTFTHVGLGPEYECYEVCSDGWGTYVGRSLRALMTTGKGMPNVGEAITRSEQALAS